MSILASTIINGAFSDINVKAANQPLAPTLAQDGLRRLNQMILGWRAQSLTVPFVGREVFSVVANQALYTVGPGGDFDTVRPQSLRGTGLLLNSSTPPVEIPRGLLTDDGYEAIQIKDLSNSLWTNVYFNPTYSSGWASVTLWPVPNTADNDCVLYRDDTLAEFPTLTSSLDVPPGYEDALEWNLAKRLLVPYAVQAPAIVQQVRDMASETLLIIKRQNYKLTDLPVDAALTDNRRGNYNIDTGVGGQVY